jgi:hypothetical protein
MDEIRKVAVSHEGKYWILNPHPQTVFPFARDASQTLQNAPLLVRTKEYEHNEILWALASLAKAAGFDVYVGKKEQSSTWNATRLGDLSVSVPPFIASAAQFTADKVAQIDLMWLDRAEPVIAFEVEHTSSITSGIERFHELLRLRPNLAGWIVLVAPKSRRRKLTDVLTKSHFVGAPMYMDTKLRYLWYSDVQEFCEKFGAIQPDRASLLKAMMAMLQRPQVP